MTQFSSLEKSILSTIVYYDVLGLPLTNFEVYKYLQVASNKYQVTNDRALGFYDVLRGLESSEMLKKYLDQKSGFYFLKERGGIVKERIKKEKIIQEKWKKCRSAVKLLGGVPFLRTVALSGSMAVGNASKESDVDLLIITKKGRIWTTRLLVTILLSILGRRRHGKSVKDRICLNHYITDESLKVDFPSLYNAQTYVHLVPVLGDADLFVRFQKENSWIKNWIRPIRQAQDEQAHHKWVFSNVEQEENLKYFKPSSFLKTIARFGELILWGRWGSLIERILARWQRKVMQLSAENNIGGRGRITVNNSQLEFHPDSPESYIIGEYNKKMKELGFPEMAREKDSGLRNY